MLSHKCLPGQLDISLFTSSATKDVQLHSRGIQHHLVEYEENRHRIFELHQINERCDRVNTARCDQITVTLYYRLLGADPSNRTWKGSQVHIYGLVASWIIVQTKRTANIDNNTNTGHKEGHMQQH